MAKKSSAKKETSGGKVNWNQIKHEYVTGDITYRELSEKYGVSIETIKKQARKTDKREGWVTLKRKHRDKVYTKAAQKSAENSAEEIVSNHQRVKDLGERLIDEAESAIKELRQFIVEHETVQKEVEFDYNTKKPKKETITTIKDIELIEGTVNTKGLMQVAKSLLLIRDLLGAEKNEDNFGIIELPPMETPVAPSDDEVDEDDEQ